MREISTILPDLAAIAEIDLERPQEVRAGALTMEGLLLHDQMPQDEDIESYLEPSVLERLQQLYERFETDLEFDFAKRVVEGKSVVEDYPLYDRMRTLVQAEIALAGIIDRDKVAFIGSGPFPLSAMLIAQLTSASVDCYDISREACDISQRVIEQVGLSENIRVINSAGQETSVYGYDAVVVALLAQPKQQIMTNFFMHAPRDVRVICRNSEGVSRAFYKGIAPATLTAYKHFEIVDHHHAGTDDTISSLLVKKGRDPDTR